MTYNRFIQGLKARRRRGRPQGPRRASPSPTPTAFAALVEVAKANVPAQAAETDRRPEPTPARPTHRPAPSAPPRVVAARKLLRRAGRDRAGRFLVEGAQAVREALPARGRRGCTSCSSPTPRRTAHPELLVAARAAGVRVSSITERAAESLSDTVTPQGLFAVCDLLDVPLDAALAAQPHARRRVRRRRRPGQRGHGRSGSPTPPGADAVVLAGDTVDPHNGKAVRASTGSVFHLPLARDRDAASRLERLPAAGLRLLVADGARRARPARPGRRPAARRAVAWIFGSEAHGVPAEVAAAGRPPGAGTDPRPRREPQPRHRRGGLPLRERRRPAAANQRPHSLALTVVKR